MKNLASGAAPEALGHLPQLEALEVDALGAQVAADQLAAPVADVANVIVLGEVALGAEPDVGDRGLLHPKTLEVKRGRASVAAEQRSL